MSLKDTQERIGVSQAYGVGETVCHCDFVCTSAHEQEVACACVCTCMQPGVLVKQSVSVLTALSHTADQSQGILQ